MLTQFQAKQPLSINFPFTQLPFMSNFCLEYCSFNYNCDSQQQTSVQNPQHQSFTFHEEIQQQLAEQFNPQILFTSRVTGRQKNGMPSLDKRIQVNPGDRSHSNQRKDGLSHRRKRKSIFQPKQRKQMENVNNEKQRKCPHVAYILKSLQTIEQLVSPSAVSKVQARKQVGLCTCNNQNVLQLSALRECILELQLSLRRMLYRFQLKELNKIKMEDILKIERAVEREMQKLKYEEFEVREESVGSGLWQMQKQLQNLYEIAKSLQIVHHRYSKWNTKIEKMEQLLQSTKDRSLALDKVIVNLTELKSSKLLGKSEYIFIQQYNSFIDQQIKHLSNVIQSIKQELVSTKTL